MCPAHPAGLVKIYGLPFVPVSQKTLFFLGPHPDGPSGLSRITNSGDTSRKGDFVQIAALDVAIEETKQRLLTVEARLEANAFPNHTVLPTLEPPIDLFKPPPGGGWSASQAGLFADFLLLGPWRGRVSVKGPA